MKTNKKDYTVYIVRCKYGTLYSGYTINIEKRLKLHNEGKGAKYLRGRTPIELVYTKRFSTLSAALKHEKALKRLSAAEKQNIITSS